MPRQLTRLVPGSAAGAGRAAAAGPHPRGLRRPGERPRRAIPGPGEDLRRHPRGGDGTGMEQVIIPAFGNQFGNITVEHASLGGEPDYWAKVVTGHLGSDLADVVWASTGGFTPRLRGVFKELEPWPGRTSYDFKDYVPAGPGYPQDRGQAAGSPGGPPRLHGAPL